MSLRKNQKRKKRTGVKRVLLALLIAGVLLMAGGMTAIFVGENTPRPPKEADVVIVLGARVMPDGELSTTLLHRIETAYSVYRDGYSEKFIVCGAQGSDEPMTEAKAMAEYLIEQGVPAENVFLEDQSFNTVENLKNARKIMDEQGLDSALIVTSDYHVARSLRLCADAGIEASGINAPGPDYWHNRMKARARETLSWIYYLTLGR